MASVEIVVVNGIRYRVEDAKRLGLVSDKADDVDGKQRKAPANKAGVVADKSEK